MNLIGKAYENSISDSYERDALLYCTLRKCPQWKDAIVVQTQYMQLLKDLNFQSCLENREYIPLLKWVWCQSDRTIALEWLRSKREEDHAPLLCELAIEEFEASKTAETLHEVSIPLIRQAMFCTLSDSLCLKVDKTFRFSAMNAIERSYMTCLENMSIKYLEVGIEGISKELLNSREKKIKEVISLAAQRVLGREPVKKNWLRWYGRDCLSGTEIPMKKECKGLVDSLAGNILKKI